MAASVAHDLQEIPSDGGEVLRNGMWTVFFFFFFGQLGLLLKVLGAILCTSFLPFHKIASDYKE